MGVTISDDYSLTGPANEVTVCLVTPSAVDISQPGIVTLSERAILDGRLSASGQVTYDPAIFSATVETVTLTDERMGGTWGAELYRVVLTAANPTQSGTWTYRITGV
ncbi:MAG TPA: hypothetical protein PL105_25630 [Caldilineaceae bacterium]|nr:hypothetical protein [Caldilineaceae bacterium]